MRVPGGDAMTDREPGCDDDDLTTTQKPECYCGMVCTGRRSSDPCRVKGCAGHLIWHPSPGVDHGRCDACNRETGRRVRSGVEPEPRPEAKHPEHWTERQGART